MSRPDPAGDSTTDPSLRFERLPNSKELPDIVGCRERIELVAWYDRRTRKLALVGEQHDQWSTPGVMRSIRWFSTTAGPFSASEDLADALAEFGHRVAQEFDLP